MKEMLRTWFSGDARPTDESTQQVLSDRSTAYQQWSQSGPAVGEAMADTGLSSATDCQKLHWSFTGQQQALFSELLAKSVARDRALFESGGEEALAAEAKRINDLTASVLQEAGLNPVTYGVSIPEEL